MAESLTRAQFGDASLEAVIEMASALSAARVSNGAKHLHSCAEAAAFKRIRDGKLYKGLPNETLAKVAGQSEDGWTGNCGSFDEFCKVIGIPRQRVYEKIQQFEAFGEDLERIEQIGIPRQVLRLALKVDEGNRKQLVAMARDPKCDRDVLVTEVRKLARETGALERDKAALEEDLAERNVTIEKGRRQLREARAKLKDAKDQLGKYHAGRGMPSDEEDAVREFADRCQEIEGFFVHVGLMKWKRGVDTLALAHAALLLDEATLHFEEMEKAYGLHPVGEKRLAAVRKYADLARDAAKARTAEGARKVDEEAGE